MANDPEWGKRLRDARRDWEKRHDASLPYGEIGRQVGELLGRAPYSHQATRRWFVAGRIPDNPFKVTDALGTVLGTARADLAWGPPVVQTNNVHGDPPGRVVITSTRPATTKTRRRQGTK